MSNHLSAKVFALEKKMVPYKDWHTTHPEAVRIAEADSNEGVPTGIAHDDEWGWCVLQSSG